MPNGAYSLNPAQLNRLVSAVGNSRDRALLLAFTDTGIRRFEAANMKWADVDIARRLLTISRGKGGKQRVVPMSHRLASALHQLGKSDSGKFVFRSRQTDALSLRQVNRIIAQVGRRAGIIHPNPRYRNISCHLLRHTFARLWKSAEGSIESLSTLLGHSNSALTLSVYGQEGFPDVQRNYDKTLKQIFKR